MLTQLDIWLGRTVFIPIVILLRRKTGWNKETSVIFLYSTWAIASIAIMATTLAMFSIMIAALTALIAALYIPAIRSGRVAVVSHAFCRKGLILLGALAFVTSFFIDATMSFLSIISLLASEYAKMIDVLPPDNKKQASLKRHNA